MESRLDTVRAAFAISPVGLVVVDPCGRVNEVNGSLASFVGVPARDCRGLSLEELFGKSATPIATAVGEVDAGGPAFGDLELEVPPDRRFRQHEDDERPMAVRVFRMAGENCIAGLTVVPAGRGVEPSMAWLTLVGFHMREWYYRFRFLPERRWEYISSAIADAVGYLPEDHYADPDLQVRILHPDDYPWFERITDGYVHTEPFKYRLVHRDGRVVWVETALRPIRDAAGRLVVVEGSAREVTDQVEAEGRAGRASDRTFAVVGLSQALVEVGRDRDGVLRVLADHAALAVRGGADVYTYGAEGSDLSLGSTRNGDPTGQRGRGPEASPRLRRLLAQAVRTGAPLSFQDGIDAGEDHQVMAVVPLRVADEVLGGLVAYRAEPEPFEDVELGLLSEMAERSASALENAHLFSALGESEQRFRRMAANVPDLLFQMVGRRNPELTYVSPASMRILGRTPEEMLQLFASGWLDEVQTRTMESNPVVVTLAHADGYPVQVELHWAPFVDESGEVVGYDGIARDVTVREQTQEALRDSEERFRRAFEGAGVAMVLMDLGEGRRGRLMRVNNAFAELVGADPAELTAGRTVVDLVQDGDRKGLAERLDHLGGGDLDEMRDEVRYVHAAGHVIWANQTIATILGPDGRPSYAVLQAEDITGQRAAEARLAHLAMHDPLTGLPNRTLLVERLVQALRSNERRDGLIGVFYVDLDRFKFINDRYGHEGGDRLLIEVARRMQMALRLGDTVGRPGGDEFVAICPDVTDVEHALRLAHRLSAAVREPVESRAGIIVASASVGVLVCADARADAEELLRSADAAMYHAKARGRDRVELFDDSLRAQAMSRLRLESELRAALAQGLLRLVFQPVVDLVSNSIVGAEALLRVIGADGQAQAPAPYIAVAEDTSLIVPLGAWVIEEACRQQALWQQKMTRPFTVSVNVSARQLDREDTADRFAGAIARHGVDPLRLCVEITETTLLEASDTAMGNLDALARQGIAISLDDFGTGYASLTNLKRFPIDQVKIDRSFVSGLDTDPHDLAIVSAVAALGQKLDLTTVAEGVESESQLDHLRKLGCDRAQGYLFSAPRPAAEIIELAGW